MRPRHHAAAALIAAAAVALGACPASASVTLGQLGPNNASSGISPPLDMIQAGVSAGNTYVVPGNGTITSWSNNAPAAASQTMAMKIFRKTRDPNFFTVVGHDGPRPLTSGLVNTFPTNIPVQAGDLLGIYCSSSAAACECSSGGGNVCSPAALMADTVFSRLGDVQDGQEAQFLGPGSFTRLNLSAVFEPSNMVTVGKKSFNKKKGSATLNLTLPNPGDLTASGNGVKAASAGGVVISKSVGAGPVQLLIKAKGKKKKTLDATGKVKLSVAITYTPTNGSPGTQLVKVKLKKNL